ncbi:MAG: methyltransferase [Acidimicrobiales bacterium]|nr:methyltransferase [Acidimicrobiales bacterium]
MLDRVHAAALADRLRSAGYTLEEVTDRLGAEATDALARNTTLAARDALGDAADAQAALVRMFLLHDTVSPDAAGAALGDLGPLEEAGIVAATSDGVRAGLEVRPYAAAGAGVDFSGWIANDLIPILDGRLGRSRPDYVLGASPASTTLAQMTIRRPVARALDLGTGCGIQSLLLAGHADHVVATDLNPRAVAMAGLTAGLNGLDLDLRTGSLYEPVADEKFDLIVTNPPYVMSPPTGERLVYREGLFSADELVRRVVVEGADRLAPGGVLQVLGNWAVTDDEDWTDRLRGWIDPTGCDALVLQREHLDPYEYIEVWLNDAGLVGTDEYAARYRAWLDYFDALGITGVGMGWIMLHRSGSTTPDVRLEEWPHAVHQPLGEAFAAHLAGVAAATSDADLLARAWRLDERVDVETLGRPGAEDPEHIVYRQRYGFGRAVEVDTALGAVLGACDGDLTAAQIVGAVASILEVDADALAAEVVPRLRQLVVEGYLAPA